MLPSQQPQTSSSKLTTLENTNSSATATKTELKDWNQPAFGEKSTVQRRRMVPTSLVKDEAHQNQYSTSATRTAYRDTISANAEVISQQRNSAARGGDFSSSNLTKQQQRREGGTWKTSEGLQSALHQSRTTMKDAAPMQRNIEKKVVVEKIQQPKQDQKAVVDSNVVLLQGTRVRGVGFR